MNKVYTYTFPSAKKTRRSHYTKIAPVLLLLGIGVLCTHRSPSLFSVFNQELPQETLFQHEIYSVEGLKKKIKTLTPTQKKEVDLIARTVYGEARGERSVDALQAIAHVILNRTKDKGNWPSSIKEVILQKNQFSCWNERDPNFYKIQSVSFNNKDFRKCYAATLNAFFAKEDLVRGANHYHAKNVSPRWARKKSMMRVAQIQKHIFYKG